MAEGSKRLALVVGIIITGSLITTYTHHYITEQENKYRQIAVPQDEAKTAAFAGGIAIISETGAAEAGSFADFQGDTQAAGNTGGENTPVMDTASQISGQQEQETASQGPESNQSLSSFSVEAAAEEAGISPQAAVTDEAAVSEPEAFPQAQAAAASFTDPVAAANPPALSAGPAAEENSSDSDDGESAYTQSWKRLDDLDIQIQKMRDAQVDSTAYSIKALADTELKLWDRELNNVYIQIMDQLDEEEQLKLARQQREWMNQRDVQAEAAAPRNKSGAIESAEYTASLAASTRQRAYDLLESYQSYLK